MRARFRAGLVRAVRAEGPGWQLLDVELEGEGGPAPAWHDAALLGPVGPGDRVVLNTTAVWLGLGTGGLHFVYWVPGRERLADRAGPGHIVKLRYTPGQIRVHTAEERWGGEAALEPGTDPAGALGGLPVVVGTLHSQLAPAAAGIAAACPGARVVYLMTDGGALPLALSGLVRSLRRAGLVAATVTCGHAYGGDLEAVTPAAGLAAARRVLAADAVVAVMGPGVVGTGTALGTTALEAAALLDTVAALGGTPVFAPRLGSSDARARHRGLSHHAVTVLRLCRSAAWVPVPQGAAAGSLVRDLRRWSLDLRHALCRVDPRPGLRRLDRAGVPVTTMGRGPEEEPAFFAAAAAAGVLAGRMALRLREAG